MQGITDSQIKFFNKMKINELDDYSLAIFTVSLVHHNVYRLYGSTNSLFSLELN
jgi:hypothetical protein